MSIRCAIKGISPQEVINKGGREIKHAPNINTVFATMEDTDIVRLEQQGYKVNKINRVGRSEHKHMCIANGHMCVRTCQVAVGEQKPLYTPDEIINLTGINIIRDSYTPSVNGYGVNVAVIDSGILEGHEQLEGKIIYRENFTNELMQDNFNHGTGIASIIHAVAPGAGILNLKVLDGKGEGSEEDVALAIDKCIDLQYSNPDIAPRVINLSVGTPDDHDYDNIIRHACREAIAANICIVAAAGNLGPTAESIMTPAVEQYVIAVGCASIDPFEVSEFSSRGPAPDGAIKPDVIMFGENIIVASSNDDIDTTVKSGTSFSAPFVSGMVALYFAGESVNVGQLSQFVQQHSAQIVDMHTAPIIIDGFLPQVCIPPTVSAQQKSNDFGYGLPIGGSIHPQQANIGTQQVSSGVQGSLQTQIAQPIIMLPIVATLTKMLTATFSAFSNTSTISSLGVFGSSLL